MKIKLDENLPGNVPLTGIDVHTVEQEELSGALDPEVWAAAQEEGRILFTQDLDFSDLRKFMPGTHAGIVLLRLRTPSREALSQRI